MILTTFLFDVAFIHSVSEVFPLPVLYGGDFTGTEDLPTMIHCKFVSYGQHKFQKNLQRKKSIPLSLRTLCRDDFPATEIPGTTCFVSEFSGNETASSALCSSDNSAGTRGGSV